MPKADTIILHKKEKRPSESEKRDYDNLMGTPPTSTTALIEDTRSALRKQREMRILEGNLLDSEFYSSSESDISKDEEERSTLNLDFFDTFSGAPSLDNISIASGQQKLKKSDSKGSQEFKRKDQGTFVDPLTGLIQQDRSQDRFGEGMEEVTEGIEEEQESTLTEEVSQLRFSFSEDSELAVLLEVPPEEYEVKMADGAEEALDDFLMQDVIVEKRQSSFTDKEAMEQERLHNLIVDETGIFLKTLINHVIARAEYKHPRAILRENLDKYAVMEEICKKLEELELERRSRFNLNRKVIEYFKRKKSFKALTDLPQEEEAQQIARLNEATKKLDQMLSIEEYIGERYENISTRLRAQKIRIHQECLAKEKEFETLVCATLIKGGSARLAVVIPHMIEEINTFRRHVSNSRLQLIQYQHSAAILQKGIDDFENQFRMREYMALQTETTELDKKIEERNAELENSRRRCNTDIHSFTHIKEKVDILRLSTQMKKQALTVLQSEKQQVRERLVRLKVDRTNYQKEIRELTFQTGLLSKPGLLRDYDNTVERLDIVKKRVELLRQQRADLTEKINRLSKKSEERKAEKDAEDDKVADKSDLTIQLSKTTKRIDSEQIIQKQSSSNFEPELKQIKSAPESELEIEISTIHNVIAILENEEISSDSEYSVLMDKGYLTQEPLQESQDFFEKLGSVPSLNQFEDRKYSGKHSERPSKSEKYEDIGSFTDPLTGGLVVSDDGEEEEKEEYEEEDAAGDDSEASAQSMMVITEDDELLELIKTDEEKIEQPKKLDDTEAFETFMEMEKEQEIEVKPEFDWEAFERERELQRLTTDTHEFLNALIKRVVHTAEYVDPKVLLREKLDKATVMKEITNKLQELEREQRKHEFLNRRVCEYYHRKGQYRVFADETAETLQTEQDRYKVIKAGLDQMLAREEAVKVHSKEQMQYLEHKKSVLKIRNDEKLDELEQVVRKTFAYHGERLPMVVDSLLRSIAKLREEISTVRYVLIQKQHSTAALTERLRKLEDLGNNLRLHDYECLQTEVQALDKKIEDRNADLNKSRIRCNWNINVMAHLKEKQIMLRNKVKIQKCVLSDVLEQKQLARESVFKAKTERKKIREEIKELSYQCGLLDKPALMLDYDVTVKLVKEATVRVEILRHKHDDIVRKIEKYEGKCL